MTGRTFCRAQHLSALCDKSRREAILRGSNSAAVVTHRIAAAAPSQDTSGVPLPFRRLDLGATPHPARHQARLAAASGRSPASSRLQSCPPSRFVHRPGPDRRADPGGAAATGANDRGSPATRKRRSYRSFLRTPGGASPPITARRANTSRGIARASFPLASSSTSLNENTMMSSPSGVSSYETPCALATCRTKSAFDFTALIIAGLCLEVPIVNSPD